MMKKLFILFCLLASVAVQAQNKKYVLKVPAASGPSYTLPTASSSTKGGVKVGSTLKMSTDTLNVNDVTLSTLTDAATITWDYATQGIEAKVTLAGNRTLSITNLPAGKVVYLTLGVTQDATGSRTLTLPAGTKVINGGAGLVMLTTTASATDMLCFRWNGTTLFCTIGKNYN